MKTSVPKLHSIKWKDGAHAENVVHIHPEMRADIPARDCLIGAYDADLKDIVIIGLDNDGNEFLFGNNTDHMRAHYMISRAALMLLRYGDN